MDNLMLFYPLIVLLFLSFSMSVTARSVLRRHRSSLMIGRRSCRRKGRGAAMKVRTKKLYRGMWSFQKTGRPKSSLRRKITCPGTAPAAEAAVPEPLYKRFEPQKPQPAFKGFRSRGTVAEDVRYGFVMAQILDKPRSLKPYDDSF